MPRFPFVRAQPVPLSEHVDALRAIERSGQYTNFGPVNGELEREATRVLFAGRGACCTVANATLGLMIAIRHVVADRSAAKYAIVPSFTFAATAHAALWCNLTPLFCDVEPETWLPDPASVEALLDEHRGQVAALIPYATFGNTLDAAAWQSLRDRTGIPVIVDAAASLGSLDANGFQSGAGTMLPTVYSMHATKSFAAAEGGLIHADESTVDALRRMSNFGFDERRAVVSHGLNAKLSEHGALEALLKLRQFEELVAHRAELAEVYRQELRGFSFQRQTGQRQAFQFFPARLTGATAADRDQFIERAAAEGLEVRAYFDRPLHRQTFFGAAAGSLPVTDSLAADIVSLPLYDSMTRDDILTVCEIANRVAATLS